jgi:pimeloyl-ACP methyl ester carboxylesterase
MGDVMNQTRYLNRLEGRIAFDDAGQGPLVVCAPGMGDIRAEYRFLKPQLLAAGFRVVTMDLRGHGESDTGFADYERSSTGDDLVALLSELGAGPGHLIGTSFAAAAAVWAATEAPASVASLTLIGPFVRGRAMPAVKKVVQKAAMSLMLTRPWGPKAWGGWYAKLYPGAKPADFDHYRKSLVENLAEKGRLEAVRAMGGASSRDIEPRLERITVPVTVVMGTADPDFPDPAAEAGLIAGRTGGHVVLVQGAGHYPHAEQPEITGAAIVEFLGTAASPAP